MFMVVMNIRSAIVAESTLSFMGIGLPLALQEFLTQISFLALCAFVNRLGLEASSGYGVFLIVTLLSFTSIGNYLRKQANRKQRNL